MTVLLVLGLMAALFLALSTRVRPDGPRLALRFAGQQAVRLAIALPLALLAAGFIGAMIPQELVAQWLGQASGWRGIALASVLGGFVPGGPMVSYSMAIVIQKAGAGTPQMVAFLTAWSVFALHRVLTYEMPLMGPRFTAVRFAASLVLPPVSGGIAYVITGTEWLRGL